MKRFIGSQRHVFIDWRRLISFLAVFFFSSICSAQENNISKEAVKERIHVTADGLSSDNDSKSAEFVGNVTATQGDFAIKSDRLKIYYRDGADGKAAPGTAESIEKIVATGNVEIKSEDAVGLTERAEYETKTKIVVLTGENSKVYDRKNSVTGSKITLYRNDGRVKVEGDKSKKVNTVIYPDDKTSLKDKAARKETAVSKDAVHVREKTSVLHAESDKPASGIQPASSKEGKTQVVQAKAGVVQSAAPVSVVYEPSVKEKTKSKTASGSRVAPGGLRKSMGMTLFENKTPYILPGFQDILAENLVSALNGNCSSLVLFKDGDENYPSEFEMPPRLSSGAVDGFKLCEAGRERGLTVIMTGSVTDIKITDELKGVLLWKDTYPVLSMTVHVDILDTETGTKILGESFTHKKIADDIESEAVKSGKTDPAFVKEAFEQISKEAGKKICETMRTETWKGYISSVSGDRITISSGRGMGVVEGKTFEVFGSSMIIGTQGRRFFVPGTKIGEVRITKVLDGTSEAVMVSGGAIREGYTIRAK
jgi:lipopolysaccharide export system protein LptA